MKFVPMHHPLNTHRPEPERIPGLIPLERPEEPMVTFRDPEETLQTLFGGIWKKQLEEVLREPPEMKILFALVTGLRIDIHMGVQEEHRPHAEADNPVLTPEVLQELAGLLDAPGHVLKAVLNHAPHGVVATIIAVAVARA